MNNWRKSVTTPFHPLPFGPFPLPFGPFPLVSRPFPFVGGTLGADFVRVAGRVKTAGCPLGTAAAAIATNKTSRQMDRISIDKTSVIF